MLRLWCLQPLRLLHLRLLLRQQRPQHLLLQHPLPQYLLPRHRLLQQQLHHLQPLQPLQQAQPLGEWVACLNALLERFYLADEDEERQLQLIRSQLADWLVVDRDGHFAKNTEH